MGEQVRISQLDLLGNGNTPTVLDEWVEIRDPRPAASASAGNSLETQVSVFLLRPKGPGSLGLEPRYVHFNKLP